MKTKLLLVALFITFSSFTYKSGLDNGLKKNSSYHVGSFYKDGYYFDVWGNEYGIETLYRTDSTGFYMYPVYSYTGTLGENHWIDVTLEVQSNGPTVTFSGYCWF